MKIAFVTPFAPSNEGVGGVVTALAIALSVNHQVTILSARGPRLVGTTVRQRKVRTIGGPGLLFDLTFFLSSTLMLWWSRRKGRQEFDIIHYHHHGYTLGADVTTSHYCEQEGVDQLRHQPKDRPRNPFFYRLIERGWAWLEKRVAGPRRSKPLIVLSERMKRDFMRHHHTPAGKIFVIHNGVDCTKYSPDNVALYREEIRRRHSLAQHDQVVLLLGIDWVRKGIAQAVEALSLLDALPVKLLIVGPDDPTPYQELVRSRGVEAQIIFAGPTGEPWKYYAASDIFLLPTVYEAFGLVVLEAMATGLPTVVSREAGAAELIQDGRNGLLINEPRDSAEIAAKLESLLKDSVLRRQLGEAACITALQQTWDQVAHRTVEVYRRVLTNRSG